jgi:hypothetical protein
MSNYQVNSDLLSSTPTTGSRFGLQINGWTIGVVICHNTVRSSSDINSEVFTVIPRTSKFLREQASEFLAWMLSEPFFDDFFLEKDLERIIETRTVACKTTMPVDRWYVCSQFLRSFFQGNYILDNWKLLRPLFAKDPLFLLSVLMLTRPEVTPNRAFLARRDPGIIDGHMPFPYTLLSNPTLTASVLYNVVKRSVPKYQDHSFNGEMNSYSISEYFVRSRVEVVEVAPLRLISAEPHTIESALNIEVESGYKKLPWSRLVDMYMGHQVAENELSAYLNLPELVNFLSTHGAAE